MFRVQGLLPNMEICLNIVRKSERKIGKIGLVHTFVDNIGLMFFRVHSIFPNIETYLFLLKKIARKSEKIKIISRILGTAFRVHCIFPKKEMSSGMTRI